MEKSYSDQRQKLNNILQLDEKSSLTNATLTREKTATTFIQFRKGMFYQRKNQNNIFIDWQECYPD